MSSSPEQTPEQMPGISNFAVFAQVGLLMVLGVYMTWAFFGGVDAQLIITKDPDLAAKIDALVKSGVTGDTLITQILSLMSPRIHWFEIALISSGLSFAVLGFVLGKFAKDVSWAGILPLFDLLSGMNPAFIGDNELLVQLPFEKQIAVLFLQIICIQVFASWTFNKKLKQSQETAVVSS